MHKITYWVSIVRRLCARACTWKGEWVYFRFFCILNISTIKFEGYQEWGEKCANLKCSLNRFCTSVRLTLIAILSDLRIHVTLAKILFFPYANLVILNGATYHQYTSIQRTLQFGKKRLRCFCLMSASLNSFHVIVPCAIQTGKCKMHTFLFSCDLRTRVCALICTI